MVTKAQKVKTAGGIVAAAFIGAFASRWIDKSLAFPFPIDLILLVLSGLFLFYVVYKIAGDLLG